MRGILAELGFKNKTKESYVAVVNGHSQMGLRY